MVSTLQRRLSLLLVVSVTTSWFFIPWLLKPSSVPVAKAASTTAATPEDATSACSSGYHPDHDASDLILNYQDQTTQATDGGGNDHYIHLTNGKPNYQNVCFVIGTDGKTVIHKFTFPLQGRDPNFIYEQRFSLDTSVTVYGGCLGGIGVCSPKTNPNKFNFFTYKDKSVGPAQNPGEDATSVAGSSDGIVWNTFAPISLFRFNPPIQSTVDSKGQGAPNPNYNAYLLVYQKQWVYGFYQEQFVSTGQRFFIATQQQRDADRNAKWSGANSPSSFDFSLINDDSQKIDSNSLGVDENRVHRHYIYATNHPIGNSLPYPIAGSVNITANTTVSSGDNQAIQQGVIATFGNVTNSTTNSITGVGTENEAFTNLGGDLDLLDNDNSSEESPELPPVLIVSNTHTQGLPDSVHFILSNVLTVSGGSVQNNYFIFKYDDSANSGAVSQTLRSRGIDTTALFVAIDVGGNVAFLVEDKLKSGGIFAQGRNTLDDFIATDSSSNKKLGGFDGNNYNVSKNVADQDLSINLDQYRLRLTKRVYNDAIIPNTDGNDCQANPLINYGDENTHYDDPANSKTFKYGIPIGNYRKCIHLPVNGENPPGWLTKWKIGTVKLDAPAQNDPCQSSLTDYFSFQRIIGQMICSIMGIIVYFATFISAFAIDFMIKAIGMQ